MGENEIEREREREREGEGERERERERERQRERELRQVVARPAGRLFEGHPRVVLGAVMSFVEPFVAKS